MQKEGRSFVGIILACCVALAGAACDSSADRATDAEEGSSSHQESVEESRSAWLAFQRSVHDDLEPIARELRAVGKGLAEFEQMQVDRWADRVERVKEEVAKEMAEAPEKRRRDRERISREVEEIKHGVAAFFAKLGLREAPSEGNGSPE